MKTGLDRECLNSSGLSPLQTYHTPGLSWELKLCLLSFFPLESSRLASAILPCGRMPSVLGLLSAASRALSILYFLPGKHSCMSSGGQMVLLGKSALRLITGEHFSTKKKKLIACTKRSVDKYLSSCRGTDSKVPNPPFGYLIATEPARRTNGNVLALLLSLCNARSS